MSSAFRRIAVACTVVGACTAVLTVATIHPSPQTDVPRHLTSATPAVVKSRRHPGFRASHNLLSGLASWYGEVFDGRVTANGETFDQEALTACHPTLPFGTLVRVINLRNRQSVVVRINDRGALRPDRVIDLSTAAAEKIGMLDAGVAPVKLEVLPRRHS